MNSPHNLARQPGDYLEARISNASPADLQQMLLDGAVRFARKAEAIWDDDQQTGDLHLLLTRIMDTLEAITMGVAESTDPVAEQLEEQYAFLFREFAAISLDRDRARFDRAVKLLAFERETWQLGMQQARGGAAPAATPESPRKSGTAPAPTRRPALPIDLPMPGSGFSMQA